MIDTGDEHPALVVQRLIAEGRCPQRISTVMSLSDFVRSMLGGPIQLCGEPATHTTVLGQKACKACCDRIAKDTREGKNLLGIMMGNHNTN